MAAIQPAKEALYLTRFGSKVTVVLRRGEFRASKIMEERTIKHPKIEVLYHHNLVELLGDRKSGITGGVFEHAETGAKTEVNSAAIFYAIGHTPNTALFEEKAGHGRERLHPDWSKRSYHEHRGGFMPAVTCRTLYGVRL